MSKREKVTFTANFGDQTGKLFSVKTNNDGSLNIGFKSAGEISRPKKANRSNVRLVGQKEDDGRAVNDQHYSIHPSSFSYRKITTVKGTVAFQDGCEQYRLYSMYENLERGYFAPIYFQLYSDRSGAKYRIKAKDVGSAICMGSIDPSSETFACGIFVTKFPAKQGVVDQPPFRRVVRNFGEFSLWIYSFSVKIPSRWQGQIIHFPNHVVEDGREVRLSELPTSDVIRFCDLEAGIVMQYLSRTLDAHLDLIGQLDGENYGKLVGAVPIEKLVSCPDR